MKDAYTMFTIGFVCGVLITLIQFYPFKRRTKSKSASDRSRKKSQDSI